VRYWASKIPGYRLWPFGVTWRYRSRGHWIRNMGFPIGVQFEPTVYLTRLLRYWASKVWGHDLDSCEHPHNQKLESINYMTTAIVWGYLYLLLRNCFQSPRKGVPKRALTRDLTVLWPFFFWRTQANIPTNLILPETMDLDLRRWQYESISSSYHAIISEIRIVGSQTNRCENRINAK